MITTKRLRINELHQSSALKMQLDVNILVLIYLRKKNYKV